MTDQPTTTAQCGACGGFNDQHRHHCPDRDETRARPATTSRTPGPARPAVPHARCRTERRGPRPHRTVRGKCGARRTPSARTHDIEVCNRDREQDRRQLEPSPPHRRTPTCGRASAWPSAGPAPRGTGRPRPAQPRRALRRRRATEFEKALTAAKAENDGWAEATRNTDRLTSQQLADERRHTRNTAVSRRRARAGRPAQWPGSSGRPNRSSPGAAPAREGRGDRGRPRPARRRGDRPARGHRTSAR